MKIKAFKPDMSTKLPIIFFFYPGIVHYILFGFNGFGRLSFEFRLDAWKHYHIHSSSEMLGIILGPIFVQWLREWNGRF